MKKPRERRVPHIIITMADGSTRDSLEGYVLPVNDITRVSYDILAQSLIESIKKSSNEDTKK